MANSILDNNVTYSLLIDTAAGLLYNKLKSYSVSSAGTYRQNAVSMKIGGGTFKNGEAVPTYTIKIKAPEKISASYTSPTKDTIKNDIVKFSRDFVKLNELTREKERLSEDLNTKMDRWMYLEDLAERIKN